MLGNKPLRRPRSGTLILEDGTCENVKIEANKYKDRSYEEDDTRTDTAYDRAPEREYGIESNPFLNQYVHFLPSSQDQLLTK